MNSARRMAIVLFLVLVVAGCGEAEEPGNIGAAPSASPTAASDSAPTLTATFTAAPTPLPTATYANASSIPTETGIEPDRPEGSDQPRPPDATLRAGDTGQTGKLGTYCWTEPDASGSVGLCADMFALPVPAEALEVEPGAQLVFRVGGIAALANVTVEVFDFASVESQRGELFVSGPSTGELQAPLDLSGTDVVMTVDLPPGEYVISVFVGFPNDENLATGVDHQVAVVRGDANYGFHIRVIGG